MATSADRIRRARTHAGLTQNGLAIKIGVRRSAVTQWEQVDCTKPTVANLCQIAVVTDVCFEWLATGRGVISIGDLHETPAAVMSEFAYDVLESRLLLAIRRVSMPKRQVILAMVEGLSRGEPEQPRQTWDVSI